VRFFSEEERERLLRRASLTNKGLPDVIRYGLLTGCRPAEIFHIRCRSVDLKRKVITMEEQPCLYCPDGKWIPKAGAWRQVEIHPDLLPVLRRLLKDKKPGEVLFDSEHGKPFTRLPNGGGGSFKRALERAGLARSGLSFYSLRQTFAAALATAGVPLRKIAQLLGHSDMRSTEVYAHLHKDSCDGVIAKTLRLPEEWSPLEFPKGRRPEARAGHLKGLDGGKARQEGEAAADG
jgi:integrase